jgi:hypothetical protein
VDDPFPFDFPFLALDSCNRHESSTALKRGLFTMESGPWTLGWEFVLALVTLLLALFTGGLALVTRRLAGETRDEVHGQFRPVLVPTRESLDDIAQLRAQAKQETQHAAYKIPLRLRNIGHGPALNIRLSAGADSYGKGPTALGAAEEDDAFVAIPFEEARRHVNALGDLRIEYYDLAGRGFTTNLKWRLLGGDDKSLLGREGVLPVVLVEIDAGP